MLKSIVTAKWVHQNIENVDLVILDASLKLNKAGLQPSLQNIQIPGARYFDLKNEFSDTNTFLPNMLPQPKVFVTACRNLGIINSSRIVVYDNLGVYSSPRVWWMFKTMGHQNVAVLDGGLPEWIEQGFETEKILHDTPSPGNFSANFQKKIVSNLNFLKSNLKSKNALVIDARSLDRFSGSKPEPRKEIKSGHIPNAVNIPFEEVLENGKFKPVGQLAAVFNELKFDTRNLIFTCGSGVTACIVLLAAEQILENEKSVYDGSWTEWGQSEMPVQLGPG